MGHRLTVRVSPLVRIADGSMTMLSLELTRPSDDKPVSEVTFDGSGDDYDSFSAYAYMSMFGTELSGLNAVRLIDAEGGRVWYPGLDTGQAAALDRGETITSSLIFTAIDLDQVIAMIPQCGFLTLAVVDQSTGGIDATTIEEAETEIQDEGGLKDNANSPVPLERYVRAADDSTGTRTTTKEVTVTLASDVTFEVDSAELTPQADAQLQTVASQAAQYPNGGTLEIVGHTDDVADDDYNQTLSERRAQAVSDRLGQLTDLGAWQTSVTGKGESEPAVDDTTEEARAANRRVVITLTPTGGTTGDSGGASTAPAAEPSAGLPEATGPVGKGPEGVTVTGPGGKGQITVTLNHATRTGGLLLGQITVTTGPGGTGDSTALALWLSDKGSLGETARGESGGISAMSVSSGLPLLTPGGELLFPSDYLYSVANEHVPLTELSTFDSLQEAATTTICVAWPDTGQDTLTLDHPPHNDKGDYAFRLTDIPVVEG